MVKPVLVRTEEGTRLAVLFRWQAGEIRFVNSVTGRPVTIRFTLRDRFRNFEVQTDETTQAYYSHGVYDMNQVVSGESTDRLTFCSMKGITLIMGFHVFSIVDGCLEVALLWTL